MAAHQPDQVIDPGPAAQRCIDPQFRKIHGDLVEMARVAEIVGAIVRIVHRRIDADRHVEFDALGIKRIIAPVARRQIVVEGGHTQTVQATLLDEMLELAHATHPVEWADRCQREKAVGKFLHDLGQHVVVDAPSTDTSAPSRSNSATNCLIDWPVGFFCASPLADAPTRLRNMFW